MEPKTCQMRSLIRGIIDDAGVKRGTVFWTSERRARTFIAQRVAELIGAGLAGPSETKPAGPAEKKSAAAAPAGPSTDSPKSSAPGTGAAPSASQPAPASPRAKSRLRKAAGMVKDGLFGS